MGKAAVSGIVQNATAIHLFESVASSLNKTMAILVLVSVLLAIVILYNLTNINVAERIRELSTIKVLGFHNKEVTL
nr:ABC transporter permease [Streptococcus mutans]